jgi:hypothetical protein
MKKDCWEFLKKMRNSRADALQKSNTMKKSEGQMQTILLPPL